MQQHQLRLKYPNQAQDQGAGQHVKFPDSGSGNNQFASLAKYKVDRTKQQQHQQQIASSTAAAAAALPTNNGNNKNNNNNNNNNNLQTAQSQYNFQQQQPFPNQNQVPTTYPNLQQDLNQPFFADQQTFQLQTYFEKQRELALLQKQREQLLLEQQELRKQQELLRLQQLRALTSTTTTTSTHSPPVVISSTRSPASVAASASTPSILLTSPSIKKITSAETEIFLKAIANHQKKYSPSSSTELPKTRKERVEDSQDLSGIPKDLLSLIQSSQEQFGGGNGKGKPQIKIIYQTEKPSSAASRKDKSQQQQATAASTNNELLIKQLKQAINDDPLIDKNITTREILLPNGKKLQIVHAPNSTPTLGLAPSTTIKPPKAIFEELTRGVLPPGADFQVIRQTGDGALEDVGSAPIHASSAKKVTFVVLEEQPDGSYKVQGVKGNGGAREGGENVESIVERIKKGELKLPPINPSASPSPSSSLNHASSAQASEHSSYVTHPSTTVRSAQPRPASVSTAPVRWVRYIIKVL